MVFVQVREEHRTEILKITQQAKAALKRMGVNQWQKGDPNLITWSADIAAGNAWVAQAPDGRICGAYVFRLGEDPSYGALEGTWLTDRPYASIHRVCVSDEEKGRGVAGEMFSHACVLARHNGLSSVRIDTHRDNLPMQKALGKSGFVRCGRIILQEGKEAGDERIAYELLVK